MSLTKEKGDLGEAIILADILKRGYKVALPVGENWPYDLIVLRNNRLERVQCKYTMASDGVIHVKCRSTNNWTNKKYTAEELDWIACYDKFTDTCYYIPSKMLGSGRAEINLRFEKPKNNQTKKILYAKDFMVF